MMENRCKVLKLFHLMNKKGFTLIELLVVVAIIGILSAVGIVSYNGYISNAHDTKAKNALSSIKLYQEEYKSIHGSYYIPSSTCTGKSGGHTGVINTNIFDGDQIVENKYFRFCIYKEDYRNDGSYSDYSAWAYRKPYNYDYFKITNKNVKSKSVNQAHYNEW